MRRQNGLLATQWSVRGLRLLGVVVAVRHADEVSENVLVSQQTAQSVECDVLVYGDGSRRMLYSVPVMYPTAGLHDHLSMWVPKATTMDLSGETLNISGGSPGDRRVVSRPEDMDGDHVVIGFLNNSPQQPFIEGSFRHPRQARRPVAADGRALSNRWRGVAWGVDDKGNMSVDLSEATDGGLDANGEEVPVTDGSAGGASLVLAENAKLRVSLQNSNTAVEVSKDEVRITMGNGQSELLVMDGQVYLGEGAVEPVPLGTELLSQINALVAAFNNHIHSGVTAGAASTGKPTVGGQNITTAALSDDVKVKKAL